MVLSHEVFQGLLKSLVCTPSAHNVQPFRLALREDEIFVAAMNARLLPIADPVGRDLEIALGALLEGVALFFAERSIVLGAINKWSAEGIGWKGLVSVKLEASSKIQPDPLLDQVERRYSYRGKFRPFNSAERTGLEEISQISGIFVDQRTDIIQQVAQLYDDVNYRFLNKLGYIEELYSWMRFTPRHPNWLRDGLNAESIALKSIEAFGARVVLQPGIFRSLAKIGLAKPLISEAPIIRSAGALIAITTAAGENHLNQGRKFYRTWLEMTAKGIFGAPLSLLADDVDATNWLKHNLNIDRDQEVINIFRVGGLPANYQRYRAARVSADELQLKE